MDNLSEVGISTPQHLRCTRSGLLTTNSQDLIDNTSPGRCGENTNDADIQTTELQEDLNGENMSCASSEVSQNLVNTVRTNTRQGGEVFPLSDLPPDMLLRVFSFLEKNEQLHMSAVCKPWRQLIFSSACLWRKRQLTLRCSRHSRHSRHAFFYARRLGRYLHKLSVACEHPSNHACRSIAVCFRKLMTGLKAPSSLRSFKVTDLKLRHTRASVLLDISTSLERFIYSLHHLRCFQMSNSHWPAQEGLKVISSVLTSCQDSLHTLRIDGFFVPRFVPTRATDVLTSGLGHLTRLSKLSIDYFYLNDQSVLALASTRRGQLRSLKLVACDVSPHSRFVSKLAWLALTRSCPSMRVEVVVQGFTVSPAHSLPLLLCPALRVHRLCLVIGNQYTFLDMSRLNMAAVLSHVTRHFRRRLTRFEMDIDNHSDPLDAALIRLVRKCRNLVSVKVQAYFSSAETDVTLRELLRVRRNKQLPPDAGRGEAGSDVTRAEAATQEGGATFGGSSSVRTSSTSRPAERDGGQRSDGGISRGVTRYPDTVGLTGTGERVSGEAGSRDTVNLAVTDDRLAASSRSGDSGMTASQDTLPRNSFQEESMSRPSTSAAAKAHDL